MVTELHFFNRWRLRANHQATIKGDLIYALKHSHVAIGSVVCAQYRTEHILNTDLNIWNTIVKISDFKNLDDLVGQIQLFQVEKQFGSWLGWNRYWTFVWYDPVFSLIMR